MLCNHITDEFITYSVQGKLIYKDQCTKCFIEAKSEFGIEVCLKCFNGGCVNTKLNHAQEHFQKTNHCVSLRLKVIEEKPEQQNTEDITRLAIGGPGGFMIGQPDFRFETKIYCHICKEFMEGEKLNGLIQSIMLAESAFKKNSLAQWDCEQQPCEHTLTIQQVPKHKVASQNLAKCNSCDLSNNLWLCLHCGVLSCGRKNYDESGGNGHGIQHYNSTQHSLVVKLGTITPEGGASVHCYTCQDEVVNNFLKEHLANFGIDVDQQTKTEKSIMELTLDANLSLQLSKILEDGRILQPIFGPGFTGIDNIGNSCYMNSIVQVLFNIPELKQRYYNEALQHQKTCQKFAINCYMCQMTKVAYGLHSGDFCEKKEEQPIVQSQNLEKKYYQDGIRLFDFKQIVAKGNNEFLSNRQQDSLEYLDILLKWIQKGEKQENLQSTEKLFEYQQVSTLQCTSCGIYKVKSDKSVDFRLPVEHPTQDQIASWEIDEQTKRKQYETEGKQYKPDESVQSMQIFKIPEYQTTLAQSLQIIQKGDLIDINCPKCQGKQFISRQYFRTFPQYLVIPVTRFVQDNYVEKKLNADIQMKEQLDLSEFKEPQLNPDQIINDNLKQKKYTDDNIIQITSMGFSDNAAKRALIQNGNNLEAATNWIFDNTEHPTLNDPIIEESQVQGEGPVISQVDVNQIVEMGFTQQQAKLALKRTDNNLERAMDYIFNHDMEMEVAQSMQEEQPNKKEQKQDVLQDQGSSKYQLLAAVIHLGRSTHAGHYVCYIKKDGQWILYNDSRVAETTEPVLGKGYIYFYQRV